MYFLIKKNQTVLEMFAVILMLKFSMIENIRISKHVPSSLPHVQ